MKKRGRTTAHAESPEGDTLQVTIRVDKAFADRFDDVVGELEAHGLHEVETHARFLIVNGSIGAARAAALESINGVASVRKDRQYRAQ